MCGEIDKENAAPSPYGNIGFDEEGNPSGWFGGKVHLGGTVSFDETNGYQTKLERLTLGHSTQLTRRFGSTCLFRMKLPSASKGGNLGQKFLDYCKRPLVLWGSVYRAFYVKEATVFFIKTNEVWEFSERRLTGQRHKDGMSFLEFLQWYNPFKLNGDQVRAIRSWPWERETDHKWIGDVQMGFPLGAHAFKLSARFLTTKGKHQIRRRYRYELHLLSFRFF